MLFAQWTQHTACDGISLMWNIYRYIPVSFDSIEYTRTRGYITSIRAECCGFSIYANTSVIFFDFWFFRSRASNKNMKWKSLIFGMLHNIDRALYFYKYIAAYSWKAAPSAWPIAYISICRHCYLDNRPIVVLWLLRLISSVLYIYKNIENRSLKRLHVCALCIYI